MSLTRPQFDNACKAFAVKHGSINELPLHRDWSWVEHSSYPNLGYLSRTAFVSSQASNLQQLADLEEDWDQDDDQAAPLSQPRSLVSQQSMVFGVTFQVPTFYFTLSWPDGTPLSLDEILRTSLLKSTALGETRATTFALTQPGSSFPLLSQGDHPTLGTPYWYFHPCETAQAVEEVMKELTNEITCEEERLIRWLETWLMVVSTVIDLRN